MNAEYLSADAPDAIANAWRAWRNMLFALGVVGVLMILLACFGYFAMYKEDVALLRVVRYYISTTHLLMVDMNSVALFCVFARTRSSAGINPPITGVLAAKIFILRED